MTEGESTAAASPVKRLGAMWLYTVLRVVLFAVLFGVLWLVGVRGLLGALVAAVLSIPLSFVLLARPRAAFASTIEQGIAHRLADKQARQAQLEDSDYLNAHDPDGYRGSGNGSDDAATP